MTRWSMVARRFRSLTLLVIGLACAAPTAPQVEGEWGGLDASLTLSRSGGTVAYSCGAGSIDSGWVLSRDGQLTGTGVHRFGGGPVPPEGHPAHPASYSGRIEGNTLMLTVTLTDLGQMLGPFRMRRGGPAVQEMCL